MRITEKMIEEKVRTINFVLGPEDDDAIVGRYEYAAQLNSHKLVKITTEGRAQRNLLFGSTKRELFEQLYAFLVGIQEYKTK